MTTDQPGGSALLLPRQFGRSCYETAWRMLHKLRRAMGKVAREPLHGEVEVDDTWVGGEQAGLRGADSSRGDGQREFWSRWKSVAGVQGASE